MSDRTPIEQTIYAEGFRDGQNHARRALRIQLGLVDLGPGEGYPLPESITGKLPGKTISKASVSLCDSCPGRGDCHMASEGVTLCKRCERYVVAPDRFTEYQEEASRG